MVLVARWTQLGTYLRGDFEVRSTSAFVISIVEFGLESIVWTKVGEIELDKVEEESLSEIVREESLAFGELIRDKTNVCKQSIVQFFKWKEKNGRIVPTWWLTSFGGLSYSILDRRSNLILQNLDANHFSSLLLHNDQRRNTFLQYKWNILEICSQKFSEKHEACWSLSYCVIWLLTESIFCFYALSIKWDICSFLKQRKTKDHCTIVLFTISVSI